MIIAIVKDNKLVCLTECFFEYKIFIKEQTIDIIKIISIEFIYNKKRIKKLFYYIK